jgi:glycosyltransferase involved in cell wall biosynthesis
MRNNPLVSVIIPCFNYGQFVGEAIQSVLNQTYPDLEVIVVDDGSTDTTRDVVYSFRDPRIRYVYQENAGENVARNTGIQQARGEFIAFLDADDLWLPQKLEKQLRLFEEDPEVGLAYCLFSYFDSESGNVVGFHKEYKCFRGNVLEKLYEKNFIGSPTPVIKRDVFEKTGLFETDDQSVDDWTLWTKIAFHYKIDYVPEVLAKYRIHIGAMSYRTADEYRKWRSNYLQRMAAQFPELIPLRRRFQCKANYLVSIHYARVGDKKKAVACLIEAIKARPFIVKYYVRLALMLAMPPMTQEKFNQCKVKQTNGLIYLFNLRRREAIRNFIGSLMLSPIDNLKSLLGIVLSVMPAFVIRIVDRKFNNEIYKGQQGISESAYWGQY